ncbi:response regulator transcription factor [Micavibrio aeruginosavorus]|uniref:Response regulator in two-component regulatory system with PhoQ n=1 Tax=Micavibrio aeruginosavorus EPB TaxID=349215 RepID=M4VHM5_9BACT|nr:response regulator transcription factor [Micavibrio aeruginosavorus]AGH98713.1 response regulator in two-component regulatory system with PhoQ [Micavibrio aeruginosavorus EPB]
MKILIVEDDQKIRDYIHKGLKEAGHVVDLAADGEAGLHLASNEKYDVLVIDRMLPKMDGLSVIRTLRGSGNLTGVLILSALGDVDDRVSGLRSGGDDYLVKPFAFIELLARVEALGKRSAVANKTQQSAILTACDLEMDLLSRKVKRAGRFIELQAREFQLLEYLLKFKGQLVTRTMLLEGVWDYHFDPQTSVIDVHISRLRKKLGDADNSFIKTVRGAGYIIEDSF